MPLGGKRTDYPTFALGSGAKCTLCKSVFENDAPPVEIEADTIGAEVLTVEAVEMFASEALATLFEEIETDGTKDCPTLLGAPLLTDAVTCVELFVVETSG